MHSPKISIIIGLIIIAINIFLFILYFQKQGKFSFEFIKSLYDFWKNEYLSIEDSGKSKLVSLQAIDRQELHFPLPYHLYRRDASRR